VPFTVVNGAALGIRSNSTIGAGSTIHYLAASHCAPGAIAASTS